MLRRCYSEKYHSANPTYRDAVVCDEWHLFSRFKMWYDKHHVDGYELDKDILSRDKVYSPTNCVYIPRWLNQFLNDHAAGRGSLPIGCKGGGSKDHPYISNCHNPFIRKQEHLGMFKTPEEAHSAWKARKIEHVESMRQILDEIDDRLYPSLLKRYKEF